MTTSCSGGYEHYHMCQSANEFARGKSHVNGIENVQTCVLCWSFAKRRLAKFNDCSSAAFVPHLKECALATKFQAVALQPPQRRPAASYQETVQENVS